MRADFLFRADPRITDPDLLTGYPAAYRRRVVEGSLLLLLLPRWNPGSHIAVGNPSSLVSSLRSGRAIDLASPHAFYIRLLFLPFSMCFPLTLFAVCVYRVAFNVSRTCHRVLYVIRWKSLACRKSLSRAKFYGFSAVSRRMPIAVTVGHFYISNTFEKTFSPKYPYNV